MGYLSPFLSIADIFPVESSYTRLMRCNWKETSRFWTRLSRGKVKTDEIQKVRDFLCRQSAKIYILSVIAHNSKSITYEINKSFSTDLTIGNIELNWFVRDRNIVRFKSKRWNFHSPENKLFGSPTYPARRQENPFWYFHNLYIYRTTYGTQQMFNNLVVVNPLGNTSVVCKIHACFVFNILNK